MSNSQARLLGLAVVVLAGAIVTLGRETDIGLVILGISLLAFLVQFLFTFRRERFEEDDFIEQCENCGYDLTGNVSGICPECGTPVSEGSSDEEIEDESVNDEAAPANKGHERTDRE